MYRSASVPDVNDLCWDEADVLIMRLWRTSLLTFQDPSPTVGAVVKPHGICGIRSSAIGIEDGGRALSTFHSMLS